MELSVILPIHDERENIEELLRQLAATFGRMKLDDYEIIAVDDGSRDGSTELLEKLAAADPRLRVVFFRQNFGQAAAFDAGFRHAKGRYVVTMDADLQNDPDDIPRLLALLAQGNDMATGWRKKRRDGFFLRTFPSRIANWLIRRVTGTRVHDLGCSLKAYRHEITRELKLYGEMHRFIAVLIEGLGGRVAEVEVNHRPRGAGRSKYGMVRVFKVLLDLITIWFMRGFQTKPIYVFGGTGVLCMALGFAAAAFTLYEKLSQGIFVHRNPLFLIGLVLGIVGVQFLGMGIIAELIIRTYFESQFKVSYSISRTLGFDSRKCVEL